MSAERDAETPAANLAQRTLAAFDRRHDGHVAVRFGDTKWARVYLDGQDVSDHVDEADSRDGWVNWIDVEAMKREKRYVEYRKHGNVRVERAFP